MRFYLLWCAVQHREAKQWLQRVSVCKKANMDFRNNLPSLLSTVFFFWLFLFEMALSWSGYQTLPWTSFLCAATSSAPGLHVLTSLITWLPVLAVVGLQVGRNCGTWLSCLCFCQLCWLNQFGWSLWLGCWLKENTQTWNVTSIRYHYCSLSQNSGIVSQVKKKIFFCTQVDNFLNHLFLGFLQKCYTDLIHFPLSVKALR